MGTVSPLLATNFLLGYTVEAGKLDLTAPCCRALITLSFVERSRVWARSSEGHPKLSWVERSLLSHHRASGAVEAWKGGGWVGSWLLKQKPRLQVCQNNVVLVPGMRSPQSISVWFVVSSKCLLQIPSLPRHPQDVYSSCWYSEGAVVRFTAPRASGKMMGLKPWILWLPGILRRGKNTVHSLDRIRKLQRQQ